VELTAPYFHDGSAATLEQAVRVMAKYQLGRALPDEDVTRIVLFLKTLTGEAPDVTRFAVAEAEGSRG
jgi:cytochrome c peroxidase